VARNEVGDTRAFSFCQDTAAFARRPTNLSQCPAGPPAQHLLSERADIVPRRPCWFQCGSIRHNVFRRSVRSPIDLRDPTVPLCTRVWRPNTHTARTMRVLDASNCALRAMHSRGAATSIARWRFQIEAATSRGSRCLVQRALSRREAGHMSRHFVASASSQPGRIRRRGTSPAATELTRVRPAAAFPPRQHRWNGDT